jgi:hypothetical protein
MAFVPSPLGILPEAWGWRGCACKPVHFQPARPSAESRASLLPSFLLFRCPFSPPSCTRTTTQLHAFTRLTCTAASVTRLETPGAARRPWFWQPPLRSSAFAERRRGVPSNFSLARPPHRTPHTPHHTHALLTTHTTHRRDSLLASGSPRLPAQVPLHHHQLFNPSIQKLFNNNHA